MTNPNRTTQLGNIRRENHIANQAGSPLRVKLIAVKNHHSGRILTAMLQSRQPIVKLADNFIFTRDADYSTHRFNF
jgi:hypothetical protein